MHAMNYVKTNKTKWIDRNTFLSSSTCLVVVIGFNMCTCMCNSHWYDDSKRSSLRFNNPTFLSITAYTFLNVKLKESANKLGSTIHFRASLQYSAEDEKLCNSLQKTCFCKLQCLSVVYSGHMIQYTSTKAKTQW